MAPSPYSTARSVLCAAGLALVVPGDAARAQQADVSGLRGTGTTGTGNNLTPATGTGPLESQPFTGATPLPGLQSTAPGESLAPNYGRPHRRANPELRYPGQPRQAARPLPVLVPYPAPSTARQARVEPPRGQMPARNAPPTVASIPQIPAKRRPKVDENPYAPIGVPLGSLRLVPYVDIVPGYDSNPDRAPGAHKGSTTLRGEVGASWLSNWSVHELKGDFKAGYSKYFSTPLADRPDAAAKTSLRLDVTRDTTLDFELRGNLDTQRPGSTELTATSIRSRPLVITTGATAGAARKFGDFEVSLRGAIDRTSYEDATLVNGTTLALSDNSFNAYGLRLRAGYQITPGVTPFVEASVDARRRDVAVDGSGFARDSNGVALKAGTSFELTRTLTGEVSAGYAERKYQDSRLPTLAGATFDAALVWTASPLTTVTLRGATTLSETTVANASGAVNRTVALDISHALMRNLTLGAVGTIGVNNYQGISLRETTLTGGVKAEYALNRSVSVRGSFTHERLQSTAPGADYTANVFLLGLKLQR